MIFFLWRFIDYDILFFLNYEIVIYYSIMRFYVFKFIFYWSINKKILLVIDILRDLNFFFMGMFISLYICCDCLDKLCFLFFKIKYKGFFVKDWVNFKESLEIGFWVVGWLVNSFIWNLCCRSLRWF